MDSVTLAFASAFFLLPVAFNSGYLDAGPPEISPQDKYEYCSGEEFRARCGGPNEVIVIVEASYGRDSFGRCFAEGGEAQTDCLANFTEHLDAACSGQRSCKVRVPNPAMERVNRCQKNLRASLYASYRCIKVAGGSSCQACQTHGHVKLTGVSGYLPSIVTAETEENEGCGSSRCPWLIQALPGQSINITLFDFTVAQQPVQQQPAQQYQQQRPGVPSDRCPRLLVIKERANPKDSPVCGGRAKHRQLYLSVSHVLEVHVISESVAGGRGQFLVYYEAIGCPDIVPPKYSRMKRMHNRCEIDCPNTPHKWVLDCVDNQWVGEVGKCPLLPIDDSSTRTEKQKQSSGFWSILSSLPLNVLITLVVAVTVIIGVIIITTGIVCLKKNRYKCRHRPDSAIYTGACSEFEFRQDLVGANSALVPKVTVAPPGGGTSLVAPPPPPQSKPRRPSADLLMPVRDNTYAADRCMESRPLPAIPDSSTPRSSIQREHPNRVMVQVHPSTETVNSNQARPTIVCRGGGPAAASAAVSRDDRRHQPQASPNHRVAVPVGAPSSGSNVQGDNHHYFILDPDVLVEEPAAPCSGMSLNYRSTESQTQTVPLPLQNPPEGGNRGGAPAMGQCISSANGIQLRPIRDAGAGQQKKPNTESGSSSGIGSWP